MLGAPVAILDAGARRCATRPVIASTMLKMPWTSGASTLSEKRIWPDSALNLHVEAKLLGADAQQRAGDKRVGIRVAGHFHG